VTGRSILFARLLTDTAYKTKFFRSDTIRSGPLQGTLTYLSDSATFNFVKVDTQLLFFKTYSYTGDMPTASDTNSPIYGVIITANGDTIKGSGNCFKMIRDVRTNLKLKYYKDGYHAWGGSGDSGTWSNAISGSDTFGILVDKCYFKAIQLPTSIIIITPIYHQPIQNPGIIYDIFGRKMLAGRLQGNNVIRFVDRKKSVIIR
jgi:hypothetical protein